MTFLNLTVSAAFVLFVSSCHRGPMQSDVESSWDDRNNPKLMLTDYQTSFDALPLRGAVSKTPWSDPDWSVHQGGIAYRWRTGILPEKFFSEEELRKLSSDQISNLSPAEKYDILIGNDQYNLAKSEMWRTNPNRVGWDGLCNGWVAASIHFAEPKPIIVKNTAGISIPFGSSDIKALLSYAQAGCTARMTSIGTRCEVDFTDRNADRSKPECQDVHPASFHILIANKIGLSKTAFVAEVEPDQKMNHRAIKMYQSKVEAERSTRSDDAAPDTTREIELVTTIQYVAKHNPDWTPTIAEDPAHTLEKSYRYRLELNIKGEIIGGKWLQEDHPDYLWMQDQVEFNGYFEELGRLYEKAIQN